jgi:hypothetical protein
MRRDSLDELACAGELHRRNLPPANTIFKLAGLELERVRRASCQDDETPGNAGRQAMPTLWRAVVDSR